MALTFSDITRTFGSESVLRGASCQLSSGDRLTILGASGCGKTTLLRILAGLERADSGTIELDGNPIMSLPTEKRGIGLVSQQPSLFPHLTVASNLSFGLEVKRYEKGDIMRRVESMLAVTGLSSHADKKPKQLSGGQQQRLAFGRSVIVEPGVLLLDEPFSSLDPTLRSEMQQFYVDLAVRLQLSTIFVTHDVKEALITGSRFAVLRDGCLHHYSSSRDFLQSGESGIEEELQFWENLRSDGN